MDQSREGRKRQLKREKQRKRREGGKNEGRKTIKERKDRKRRDGGKSEGRETIKERKA